MHSACILGRDLYLYNYILCLIVALYSLAVARVPPPCSRFSHSASSSDSSLSYPDDELCCIDCERKLFSFIYYMYGWNLPLQCPIAYYTVINLEVSI